jgi:hypothetical protein
MMRTLPILPPWARATGFLFAGLFFWGCNHKSSDSKPTSTTATAPTAEKSSAPKESSKLPMSVFFDDKGVTINGDRPKFRGEARDKHLKQLVKKHVKAAEGTVRMVALRKASTSEVAMTVHEFFKEGVEKITISTLDRSRKQLDLELTPESKAKSVSDCSVIIKVLKDRSTASWAIKGGGAAKRYPKGMAGPDMTLTLDGVRKQLNKCETDTMVFAGDEEVEWGLTFDLPIAARGVSPSLELKHFVLSSTKPVSGQKVKF